MNNWQAHHEKYKQHEKARNELKNATGRIPLEKKHIADAHFDAMRAHQDVAHSLRVLGKAKPADIDRAHKLSSHVNTLKEGLDEVLDVAQRQKRAQIMRRYKAKITRSRELAKKRMAPEKNIKKRAYAQARQIVRRKVAGKRGAEYEKLGPSEKMAIDRAVEGKQKIIKKIALRLIPRVKQAEQQRLSSFMKGHALQNHGKIEGGSGSSSVQENLDNYFAEQFPPMAERSARKQPAETTDTVNRKNTGKEVKGNTNIIQHSKFEEARDCNSTAYKAIAKKAVNSGISEDILGEVYDRGLEAWYEETGVSHQQYAFARVNSFINQGKSYFNEDADLHEVSLDAAADLIAKARTKFKDTNHPVHKDIRKLIDGINYGQGGSAKTAANSIQQHLKESDEDADLQEISSKTLDRYVNRASSDFTMSNVGARNANPDEQPQFKARVAKRRAGIARAIDKQDAATGRTPEKPVKVPASMKEDAELDEATNYHVSDEDHKLLHPKNKAFNSLADAKRFANTRNNYVVIHQSGKDGNIVSRQMYSKHSHSYPEKPSVGDAKHTKDLHEAFSNWSFEMKPGDKTKVLTGDHKGKRGVVVSKHEGGAVYKIKHHDGSVMKHHISTLDEPVNESIEEGTMKPYVKPHYGDPNNPDKQTGWKSANKHGKTKFWQPFAKQSAMKHAGINEEIDLEEGREVELHDGGPSGSIKKATLVGKHVKPDHVVIRTKNYLGKPTDLVIHKSWVKEEVHIDETTFTRNADMVDMQRGTMSIEAGLKKYSKKDIKDGIRAINRFSSKLKHPALKEEVQQTNENFIDGKGPGKPGDAARHGLKGKSAAELRKIRSSETASPRKKQLAHWMLNMTKNEETELDEKRGLWDNIHAKRKRIKAGSGERMRKPGSKGAPSKQDFVDASEEVAIPDDTTKKLEKISKQLHKSVTAHAKQRDIIKSLTSKDKKDISEGLDSDHYKALTDIELNTKNRDMTTQNDGYGPLNPLDEKGSEKFWGEKAKMWKTTPEAAKEARCGNCAFFNQSKPVLDKIATAIGERGETVSDLAGFGFCELWEFKCAALRTCNTWVLGGPIKEETMNGTHLVDKESKNSKLRRRIEKVDRATPHTEHGKQQALQKKIIDEEGNTQPDPKKRLVGTNSLVTTYKKDTPGQSLDENFNIAFASGVGVTLTARDLGMQTQGGFQLHPSVIAEMQARDQEEVDEEVRSADVKGVIVRTATGKTVVRRQKANRKIIGSGNLTDDKPDDSI